MIKYPCKYAEASVPRIEATQDFVDRNNLKLVRSQEEIATRFKEKVNQTMDFEPEVLANYMEYQTALDNAPEEAKEMIKESKDEWIIITDTLEATQDMLDYMILAWDKSYNAKGISASRSIDKIAAYLWLLGRDDLVAVVQDANNYNPYGAPALLKVCEALGVEVPDWFKIHASKKVPV